MSVESQIGELVAAFVADLDELVRETALEHVRALLGVAGPGSTAGRRAPRLARRVKSTEPEEEAPSQHAAATPEASPEAARAVDPWMRPLRPGVLETLEVRRRRRRGPNKRRTEPTRAPLPRQPPVRALRVDGVTIIPSDDTDEAPRPTPAPVEPALEAAPAPAGAEPARKWVVVRRPARDKQDGSGEGNGDPSGF